MNIKEWKVMEYALQLSMNQLLSVIKTLPVNEKSFLKTCIEKDIAEDKRQNNITQLLLAGPTMSDEQYLSYQQLRKDFRKWSKKLF
ncbi:MAG: hypothetical protein FWF53_05935 [Candidatus Azobacteroides sp.]|nr:hypothetical protein [Candidatus Azobacteroides sp.]